MAAKTINKKPNVTPKASEIEVKEGDEKKVNKDVVVEEHETSVESDVKNTTDAEVTMNEDIEKVEVPKDRMVKIRLRENHRCTIGGVTYDLKKGVTVNVPEFVKSVLSKADLLLPL